MAQASEIFPAFLEFAPKPLLPKSKKESGLQSINIAVLERESDPSRTVDLVKAEEVEADEMWSFVGNKQNQRWLGHAIDHETGEVLAYVIGQHQDSVLLKLKALLEPFGVRHFFTDGWGGYERHISAKQLSSIGKENTQKIEKKHLTLRTIIKRLTRKTICFSKSERIHDIVLGFFIKIHEFGLAILTCPRKIDRNGSRI